MAMQVWELMAALATAEAGFVVRVIAPQAPLKQIAEGLDATECLVDDDSGTFTIYTRVS